jgi:thiamine biosynthesis lipoprotein
MGTRFEVVLCGEDDLVLHAAGEEAVAHIEDCHRRLSRFDPGSLVWHINANASSRAVPLDDDLFDLLDACRTLHRATGGAFDPTVGPLMQAWGFHQTPDPPSVTEAMRIVGMDKVELDDRTRTVRFLVEGVSLDLGGVAKGDALDGAGAILRDLGVRDALLHAGTSTVVALGTPTGQDAWRVGVGTETDAPTVALGDSAFSVSAPSGRTVRRGDETVGHVLDPRTGRPAVDASMAAIVTDSARDADAWSTALLAGAGGAPGTSAVLRGEPATWLVRGDYPHLFTIRGAAAPEETP